MALLTGLSLGSLNLVLFSAYAASLYYGATRVAAGAMSGGDVLAVMMAALLGAYSLGQATPLLQSFLQGRAAAARLMAAGRLQPVIDVDAPGETLPAVAGELRLQHVTFSYHSSPVPVLKGVSLCIPAGQTVALVGSSGSGKSSVVSLLQRFYDPSSGCVTLDGVDIRRLQLKWLR
jgi:ATP-binding cassette subfamily B (MDR/TAP) protein 1